MEEFKKLCDCGSGKQAGTCCKSSEDCPCGSKEAAGDCCFEECECGSSLPASECCEKPEGKNTCSTC